MNLKRTWFQHQNWAIYYIRDRNWSNSAGWIVPLPSIVPVWNCLERHDFDQSTYCVEKVGSKKNTTTGVLALDKASDGKSCIKGEVTRCELIGLFLSTIFFLLLFRGNVMSEKRWTSWYCIMSVGKHNTLFTGRIVTHGSNRVRVTRPVRPVILENLLTRPDPHPEISNIAQPESTREFFFQISPDLRAGSWPANRPAIIIHSTYMYSHSVPTVLQVPRIVPVRWVGTCRHCWDRPHLYTTCVPPSVDLRFDTSCWSRLS